MSQSHTLFNQAFNCKYEQQIKALQNYLKASFELMQTAKINQQAYEKAYEKTKYLNRQFFNKKIYNAQFKEQAFEYLKEQQKSDREKKKQALRNITKPLNGIFETVQSFLGFRPEVNELSEHSQPEFKQQLVAQMRESSAFEKEDHNAQPLKSSTLKKKAT